MHVSWETHAKEGRLKDAVLAYVRDYDWVTFGELQRRLEPYFDMKGEYCLSSPVPNLFYWAGLSSVAVETFVEMLHDKQVYWWPAERLSYLVDGVSLTLPIPKRIRKQGYTKPHWIPVCLRLQPWK